MAQRALAAFLALVLLSACESASKPSDLLAGATEGSPAAQTSDDDPVTTGSPASPTAGMRGAQEGADARARQALDLGRKQFAAGDFVRAEREFGRALALDPRNVDARLARAASRDRLRRFNLADQDYETAVKIAGVSAEILNNQGYSYMLRGENGRAREVLVKARTLDPQNPYVSSNLDLLDKAERQAKTQ